MRFVSIIFFFFFLVPCFLAAQKLTNADYADYKMQFKSIAIQEMKLYKIPASITLAQGMIESGCGKSTLAVESRNHFGIKCQKDWTGEKYYYDDDAAQECFRKYTNVEASFRDHSLFLSTRARYASLFKLSITDYKAWSAGLKQAGYATNPEYANILIRVIETNRLYLLDDTLAAQEEEISEIVTGDHSTQPAANKQDVEIDKILLSKDGRIIFRGNYKMPNPAESEYLYTSDLGRKVYQNCGVPFVYAKKDDTWCGIAKEFKIFSFQVYRQNDLRKDDPITAGRVLYLEPKNRKNPSTVYQVKAGDSMYSIAQEKCIKLRLLLKYNKLKPGDEPEPGFELKLH
ncbi:MAG: glucosaminidase domain-containing protein [Bacteroidota bacterium]